MHARVYKQLPLLLTTIFILLTTGVMGFHYINGMNWTDSIHTSSLYVSGLGSPYQWETDRQKYWSTFYALFSSSIMLSVCVTIIADITHFLHKNGII